MVKYTRKRLARRSARPRGILLLIVLSLLVLFVLVGMTFIIVTNQSYQAARDVGSTERVADPPEKLLDESLRQLLRGSRSRQSATFDGGILGDKYGNDFESTNHVSRGWVNGENVTDSVPGVTEQFLRLQLDLRQYPSGAWYVTPDSYAGCELTMLSGPAKHITTRIVRSGPDPFDPQRLNLHVERFVTETGQIIPAPFDPGRYAFHVNGRPFNGTGAGYDPISRDMRKEAIQPNSGKVTSMPNLFLGGQDESWDLPDFQNNFLARVPAIPEKDTHLDVIPSFHRPALMNYWNNDSDLSNPQLLRTVMTRPNWFDHPNFSGSNPALDKDLLTVPPQANQPGNASNGILVDRLTRGIADLDGDGTYETYTYDVDNDSDGIPESVWIDIGLPAQRQPDGTLYKPLVAVKCIDLDGRANLNCIDNLESLANHAATFSHTNLVGGTTGNRPTGSGYGPADVKITVADTAYPTRSYIVSSPVERTNILRGRYGLDGQPGGPGIDRLGMYDLLGFPANFGHTASNYAQPPDLFGLEFVGIDHMGQTVRVNPNVTTVEHPYEMSPLRSSAWDTPYSVADMEPLLRSGDSDAVHLPNRLGSLAGATIAAVQTLQPIPNNTATTLYANRELLTTLSVDIPVPNNPVPSHLRVLPDPDGGGPLVSATLEKLMRARLIAGGSPAVERDLQFLLAPELRRGEKLNLNRILGDGTDDGESSPVQGTVDIAEADEPTWRRNWGVNDLAYTGRHVDPSYTDDFAPEDQLAAAPPAVRRQARQTLARQMLARHLYALAMLLAEHNPDVANSYFNMPGPQNNNQSSADFARRMAQWSVNVVDFRDADAVMTRFVYDINPFNGWDVSPTSSERDVVYGSESPELLISETLAFHDRRVADTYRDDGPQSKRLSPLGGVGDPHLDQEAIPQGSLFIEVFCPRGRTENSLANMTQPMTHPPVPTELYAVPGLRPDAGTPKVGLNLARMSPMRSDGRQLPVWRLSISVSQLSKDTGSLAVVPNTPLMSTDGPQRDIYDPNRAPFNLAHDRYIWFTSEVPASEPDRGRIYYSHPDGYTGLSAAQLPAPILSPGGYAVVAPRIATRFGLQLDSRDPSRQVIQADPTNTLVEARVAATPPNNPVKPGLLQYDCDGSQIATPFIRRNPLTLIATADPPTSWTLPPTTTYRVGVNVSEPVPALNYYQKPPSAYLAPGDLLGYYGAPYSPFESIPDEPLDFKSTTPLGKDNLLATGTYPNYRSVFLQRLANPLLAWNPEPNQPGYDASLPVNPYVTVDWMPIDLTVFNGHEVIPFDPSSKDVTWDYTANGAFDSDPSRPSNPGDPQGDELATDLEGSVKNGIPGQHIFELFASRERGFDMTKNQLTVNEFPNVYSPVSQMRRSDQVLTEEHFLNRDVTHSLGHLNVDRYLGVNMAPAANYEGSPRKPFPLLTWNNRPYANALELMLVPASSPGRLLLEFNEDDEYMGVPGQLIDPTVANDTPYPAGATRKDFFRPHRHLWNFFHASTANIESPNLYRLFDYVHVPSRFSGTERWYNPTELDPTTIVSASMAGDPRQMFATPFNRVSQLREPGKINLNTVGQPVFEAIFPPEIWRGLGTNWANFARNRRGYLPDAANPQVGEHFLHNRFPSEFANPYRGSAAADLYFPKVVQDAITANNLGVVPATGTEATLLRRKGQGADQPNDPLFSNRVQSPMPPETSVYDAAFRWDALKRLGNVSTTHSNVFAVWVTVGYFELERAVNPDPVAHPDGYQLGREVGIDSGEIRRHRAFYIIDRSIPVAYERGADHNVNKCIVLRRILEQ